MVREDVVSAPSNYDDFFRTYYDYTVRLVQRFGIEFGNAEDVAGSILCRFYERDIIAMFDPDKVISHNGELKRARFQSFLNAMVSVYVRSYRQAQSRKKYHEVASCDDVLPDSETSWLEIFGPSVPDDVILADVYKSDLVRSLRSFLAKVPRRSNRDKCDLLALFNEIERQVSVSGKIDVSLLSKHFDVSSAAIRNWIKLLRLAIRDYQKEENDGTR